MTLRRLTDRHTVSGAGGGLRLPNRSSRQSPFLWREASPNAFILPRAKSKCEAAINHETAVAYRFRAVRLHLRCHADAVGEEEVRVGVATTCHLPPVHKTVDGIDELASHTADTRYRTLPTHAMRMDGR